jgi:hypothetical protein
VTRDLPALGPVTIAPLLDGEQAFVLATWQHSSHWRRKRMVAVVDAGTVLVARSEEGVALGWLALSDGKVAHGYVKSMGGCYRGNGVMRALWDAAGQPSECVNDATRRARRVLAHLTKEQT